MKYEGIWTNAFLVLLGIYKASVEFVVNGQRYTDWEYVHVYNNLTSAATFTIPRLNPKNDPSLPKKVYIDLNGGKATWNNQYLTGKNLLRWKDNNLVSDAGGNASRFYKVGDTIKSSDVNGQFGNLNPIYENGTPKHLTDDTLLFDGYWNGLSANAQRWRFVDQVADLKTADVILGDTVLYVRWKQGSSSGLNLQFVITAPDPLREDGAVLTQISGVPRTYNLENIKTYDDSDPSFNPNTYPGNRIGPINIGASVDLSNVIWTFDGKPLAAAGTNPVYINFYELYEDYRTALANKGASHPDTVAAYSRITNGDHVLKLSATNNGNSYSASIAITIVNPSAP